MDRLIIEWKRQVAGPFVNRQQKKGEKWNAIQSQSTNDDDSIILPISTSIGIYYISVNCVPFCQHTDYCVAIAPYTHALKMISQKQNVPIKWQRSKKKERNATTLKCTEFAYLLMHNIHMYTYEFRTGKNQIEKYRNFIRDFETMQLLCLIHFRLLRSKMNGFLDLSVQMQLIWMEQIDWRFYRYVRSYQTHLKAEINDLE